MKKAAFILASLIAARCGFSSDGLITFANLNTPAVNPRTGVPLDSRFTVAIFAGNQTHNPSATPLARTQIIGNTGLFQFAGTAVAIPFTSPGSAAIITIKAWRGFSFSSPEERGEVAFTSSPLGGDGITPPDLGNMPVLYAGYPEDFQFPEPSTYALALAGLSTVSLFRRRG